MYVYFLSSGIREYVKISSEVQTLLREIGARSKLVIAYMGNPYGLGPLDEFGTVVVNYSRDDVAQDVLAQALFGAEAMSGRLPITASNGAKFNQGVSTPKGFRMGFSPASGVGMYGGLLKTQIEV